MSLENTTASALRALGIELTPEAAGKIRSYYELLREENGKYNLTAIKGEEDVALLHFADSIALLSAYDFKGKSVIDVGTGPGFPGMPLKIAEPTIELTLLDSTAKKVEFLKMAAEAAGVRALCVNARAEEAAKTAEFRERYDIAVSRAVARLNILAELCLPFVKEGGVFIAMKSADSKEEVNEAKSAIRALGGAIEEVRDHPLGDMIRRAVIVRKASPTAARYPRRYAKIVKGPL